MIENLEDAISHAKEKAEELRNIGFDINTRFNADTKKGRECYECAAEHEQLVAWLEELKQRQEADRWISTKERMPEKDGVYLVAIQYVAKYEEGSPIHTIELLASYDTKYGQWSSPDNVIAWRNLPKPYESEAENE